MGFSISNSFQTFTNTFFGYLPNIVGFLVILLIGYVIARIVKTIVNKALEHFKVDQALTDSPAGGMVEKISPGGKPSHLIGGVAFWFIFLFALNAAIGALKIPAVTTFLTEVLAYLPRVIAAVLIFVIAAAIAGAIAAAITKTMGDTPTGKLVATIVPALIMAIAVFMILTQLQIAPAIVTITYAALLGMLALAGALAFGLGGREVAATMLDQAYQKGKQQSDQVKQDVAKGRDRAQDQADKARAKVDEQDRPSPGSTRA